MWWQSIIPSVSWTKKMRDIIESETLTQPCTSVSIWGNLWSIHAIDEQRLKVLFVEDDAIARGCIGPRLSEIAEIKRKIRYCPGKIQEPRSTRPAMIAVWNWSADIFSLCSSFAFSSLRLAASRTLVALSRSSLEMLTTLSTTTAVLKLSIFTLPSNRWFSSAMIAVFSLLLLVSLSPEAVAVLITLLLIESRSTFWARWLSRIQSGRSGWGARMLPRTIFLKIRASQSIWKVRAVT